MPLKRPADEEDQPDVAGGSAKRILTEDNVRPQLSRGDSLPTGKRHELVKFSITKANADR